jgi:hypothetical protein
MNTPSVEKWFNQAIKDALAEPYDADLKQLWLSLESELWQLSTLQQLRIAGQALCDLAGICQLRAELMCEEWEEREENHHLEEPIPDDDFLSGLVQKTMFLDVSALVRQPTSSKQNQRPMPSEAGDSIATEVPKETDLQSATESQSELNLENFTYREDEAEWAKAITQWLEQQGQTSAPLLQIQQGTGLTIVQVWLAGMQSFRLEQWGDFYDAEGVKVTLLLDHKPSNCSC